MRCGDPLACANVITDLTEMKKLEAQLIHSQKLEAVGRLDGGIAHDFNNYLTAIIGYSSLIISRGQMLRPKVLNINDEINEMLNMLERVLGEDISIITQLDEKLGNARLDPAQIEQVILNLAINAHDAMPDGGKLVIKTENAALDEKDCSGIENARPGNYICITVEDSGMGIPADHIENIFGPFFSTKEAGKGSSLGLSVIYGIIKQHDGLIQVRSEIGRGSIFKICFPKVSDSISLEQKHSVPLENLAGRGERILLVEDHEEVRSFASMALSKNGYQVLEASTVYDALIIFEKALPHIRSPHVNTQDTPS